MQQTTDNRQQTTCKRTRAHAKCNRRHTAPPHFVCGGQRAAENQQHARSTLYATASAQHGTDATQDATHDHTTRCRSMHQTQTEPTTRSRQCNVRDETNAIRTLAHLGARCAGGGGVGWSVGLGLPESDVTVESCNSQNWAFGRRNRLREIRCPKLASPKWDARRERLKLAKRQEVAEAKERESALRSRREQLVKGALPSH